MASIESNLYYLLLRLINKKKFLEMQFAFGKFDFYNCKEPPAEIQKSCRVLKCEVNGRDAYIISPKLAKSEKYILYLHGGAYVQGFVKQHWNFLATLVLQAQCTVVAPDYPLAPESTYAQAFEMVLPLYKKIVAYAGSQNVILMGDSAGGGFALALAQKLKLDAGPQPNQILLLSPWLDVTLTNDDIKDIDPEDPFLGISGLRKAGLRYAGDADPDNFMISPINGPLDGLAKISVFIGTRDIFVADTRRMRSLAQIQGVDINYREYPKMVHVWMLMNFPESRQARAEIIDLIQTGWSNLADF